MSEQTMEAASSAADNESRAETNIRPARPTVRALLLRDAATVIALLTLFGAGDTWRFATDLQIAHCTALLGALGIGVALGALWHEWGHWSGAMFTGASTRIIPPAGLSVFRFDFDFVNNNTRQFHWMTFGGQIAQWALVLLIAVFVPMDAANRVALLAGAFGFAVFASAIEVPVLRASSAGTPPLQALRDNIDKAVLKRCRMIGAGAAIVLFALVV
ncbi:MAG: hypothetical protein H6994_02680 [Pseudomonadales bacterium]|nr:hypothetical protein [Pseudomonadales bacterium]